MVAALNGRLALTLSGILLAVTWAVAGPNVPPLYDGIAVPDEPYQFLERERRGSAPPASGAEVRGSASDTLAVVTPERPPQASVILPPQALEAQAGEVTLRVDPVLVREPLPAEQVSNAYRIRVVDEKDEDLQLSDGVTAVVSLRVPRATEGLEMYLLEDQSWQRLPARAVSPTTYATVFPALGVVVVADPRSAPPEKSGAPTAAVLAAAAVLLGLQCVLVRSVNRGVRRSG
jgi:hypothetical protein